MTTDTNKPAVDFLLSEDDGRPRVLIMLKGQLDDIVNALPQLLRRLGKGGKRGRKLNAEIAATIRQRLAAGESKEVLEREFGVTKVTLENIRTGRSYPEAAE